jgi:hypothetical protein
MFISTSLFRKTLMKHGGGGCDNGNKRWKVFVEKCLAGDNSP